MSTCLFSGKKLVVSNKKEHAILAALGGRIVSSQITSEEINEICGREFDCHLADQFKIVLRCLAPMLPNKLRKTRLKLSSQDGNRIYFKRAGFVELGEPYYEYDKQNNTVTCYSAIKDLEKCKEELRQKGFNLSNAKLQFLSLDDFLYTGAMAIHPNAHISIIKCILCSFDAMLCEKKIDENMRFTRSFYLRPLLRYLFEIFTGVKKVNACDLDNFFLGYQPNGKDITNNLLKFFKISCLTPYSHVLAVSTSVAHKSLYAFWNILGIESYAICLSNNWDGESFSSLIISPIFGSSSPTYIKKNEELHFRLGEKTIYKAFFFAQKKTDEPNSQIYHFFSQLKKLEYQKALVFVELHVADDFLYSCFVNYKYTINSSNVVDLVFARLKLLFKNIYPPCILSEKISLPAMPKFIGYKNLSIEKLSEEQKSDFITIYRDYFKSLIDDFHLPGYIFTSKVVISTV